MCCVANGYNLNNEGRERVPDATSLLKFRCLTEENKIGKRLMANGLRLSGGTTIVDAALIAALPSTKNEDTARAPEMQQVKKGNQ